MATAWQLPFCETNGFAPGFCRSGTLFVAGLSHRSGSTVTCGTGRAAAGMTTALSLGGFFGRDFHVSCLNHCNHCRAFGCFLGDLSRLSGAEEEFLSSWERNAEGLFCFVGDFHIVE